MKTNLLKITLFACFVTAGITSCTNSPQEKVKQVEEAKENVVIATDNLNKAIIDSTNEDRKFREASEARITENERRISELKEDIKKEKREYRSARKMQLDEMEVQNKNLKARMQEFKEGSRDAWESFKVGFNKDMDALGKAISSIELKKREKI